MVDLEGERTRRRTTAEDQRHDVVSVDPGEGGEWKNVLLPLASRDERLRQRRVAFAFGEDEDAIRLPVALCPEPNFFLVAEIDGLEDLFAWREHDAGPRLIERVRDGAANRERFRATIRA